MEHDVIEEGRRWHLQAKQDLDDAQYNLEGERYHYLLAGDRAVRKMKLFYCAKCKSQNPKLQYQNAGILDSEIRHINNKVENIFEQ